ncbi:methylornithine synthase PylB [Desulfobacterales bacterium HSG17]|nr:methylornithine synthase PylB [Desulfobacterales bacterium HSG17]
MKSAGLNIAEIIDRLKQGSHVKKHELKYLLEIIKKPDEIELLFKEARNIRNRKFNKGIFFYGFVYFSTYCQNNCNFCHFRSSNYQLTRYRKSGQEILETARELSEAGVHLIDLTMGEDPDMSNASDPKFYDLVKMTGRVINDTGLPVMISPGIIPDKIISELAGMGVTWYACYQETFNRKLYSCLRPGQKFELRLAKKQSAKNNGLLIEEGILTGVGESTDDLAHSLLKMKNSQADQVRVMTFIPQADTPMAVFPKQSRMQELICIAVMRLLMPERLIPASLDVDGLSGLKARLDAGANVVTSIVPADRGLAGVANHSLDIEESRRTIDYILPVLEQCGLKAATRKEYLSWIRNRQNKVLKKGHEKVKQVC